MSWFTLALGLWVGGAALVFVVRKHGTLATVLSLVTTVAGSARNGTAWALGTGRGWSAYSAAPANDRNGLGWDAQSRYPSDRANLWKWCLVPS